MKIRNIIKKLIKEITEDITNTFTKSICSFCNNESDINLCNDCEYKLAGVSKNIKHIYSYNEDRIYNRIYKCNYSYSYYLSKYNNKARKYITEIKYYNKGYFLRSIINRVPNSDLAFITSYDYIVYVPITFKTYMERGFNVSKYISKLIFKKALSIDYHNKKVNEKSFCKIISIFKVKSNIDLKKIKKEERSSAVKKKFEINPKKFKGILNNHFSYKDSIKILIVDDVYTTGSTTNHLKAEILRIFEKGKFTSNSINIDIFTLFRVN